MTSLILATSDLAGTMLRRRGQADIAIGFRPRFVWGALPSRAELASSLERRSAEHHDFGTHWLDVASRKHLAPVGDHSLSLLEFCDRCSSIELWADPRPNDQLVLIWLLDFLRPHRRILSKLVVVQTDVEIAAAHGGAGVAQWRLPKLTVTDQRLELASRAWSAYQASTPQPCFDLLAEDLSVIPQLRAALIALFEELPDRETGLGATEMRMLEIVAEGETKPGPITSDLYRERGVFDFQEADLVLDGLAYCRSPVLAGFPAERVVVDSSKAHQERGFSRLSVTDFGQEVLDGELDFSQYNPIHRWWGGTELTNDRLWRWDALGRTLVAP